MIKSIALSFSILLTILFTTQIEGASCFQSDTRSLWFMDSSSCDNSSYCESVSVAMCCGGCNLGSNGAYQYDVEHFYMHYSPCSGDTYLGINCSFNDCNYWTYHYCYPDWENYDYGYYIEDVDCVGNGQYCNES